MNNSIQPMNTLDKFGYRELAELNALIQAYANAGTHDNGKVYAHLPESWYDNGVYPDFNANSGLVFLTNSEYQALVKTEYGLMMWYNTPYNGFEGTLFDLADEVNDDLSDSESNTTPAGAGNWHKDDLNAVYAYLDDDIVALRDTGADLTDLYRAKDRIVEAFILSNIEQVFDGFKDSHEDYQFQLNDSSNEPTSETSWYEDKLASQFVTDCLHDFDREIADTDDFDKYAEFIRQTMLKLDAE